MPELKFVLGLPHYPFFSPLVFSPPLLLSPFITRSFLFIYFPYFLSSPVLFNTDFFFAAVEGGLID